MARKFKTYQTSLGFFDQAIAAPSMKAALEAWGADSNLFHQGAAWESDDPDVIAATMAKPGVVLKRPVGSSGAFGENAGLPTGLDGGSKPSGAKRKSPALRPNAAGPADAVAPRKAAQTYEREEKRRDRERARQEAIAQRERERRQTAIDKAQQALETAELEHDRTAAVIATERDAVEKKARAEDARWEKERARLRDALKRARG